MKVRRLSKIALLLGLALLLPCSALAIGDAATFAQQTFARDLPMPKTGVPTDDPAYCDDVGYEVSWQMLAATEWDNTSYLGACLARPVPGSSGGLRMYVACGGLSPTGDTDAATISCGLLFANNGEGTWRISPSQFELRETSGRPHQAASDPGDPELVLAPGQSGRLDVSFATDRRMSEPYFVVWWPDDRLPPGAAQSLTVAIGV